MDGSCRGACAPSAGRCAGSAIALVVSLCSVVAQAQFTDVTASAGVAVVGVREGGACFDDVDGDDDYDVYVPRDTGSALLLNDGGGVFEDVTAQSIPGLTARVADVGCVFADLDHDGRTDLARTGLQVLEVYLNRGLVDGTVGFGDENGEPQFFFDASDAVRDPFDLDIEGLAVLDYNQDTRLDLVVQNEGGVRILENLGDGTFAESGPDLTADAINKGGTIVCDFNNDGRFDVFFTDGLEAPLVNRVLLQDASGDFTASDGPDITGINVEGGACGDVDHDGDLDLAVNVFASTHLYINQLVETGAFALVRDDRGIVAEERSRGQPTGHRR